jgi:hypothetical protein
MPIPKPPPPTPEVEDIEFQAGTHREETNGTDYFNTTWADDDHQYTAGGDGAGFGATRSESSGPPHQVGLLVARIEGNHNNYRGFNVNGGKNPQGGFQWPSSTNNAKSYGFISINGVQYMWVMPGSGEASFARCRLWRSTDHARNWSRANWEFTDNEGVMMAPFLQEGKDHIANKDGFVYAYFIHPQPLSFADSEARAHLSGPRSYCQ